MKFNILRFEDVCPDHSEVPSGAPESLIKWTEEFTKATDFFAALPRIDAVDPDLHRDIEEIDVVFISRSDFEDIFPQLSGALGLSNWTVPDSDPFDDGTCYCEKNRIIIVFDRDEYEEALLRELETDGDEHHLDEHEVGQAATIGHEIAHQVLFLQNSCGLSFADVESMSSAGDLDYDPSDFISGYGMRRLTVGGFLMDPVDEDDAVQIMEEWCEEWGRNWAAQFIFSQPDRSFYAACGINVTDAIKKAMPDTAEPDF